jgi:hypothetical protein
MPSRPQPAVAHSPYHEWPQPQSVVWAQFFRVDDHYLIRFPGLADFELAADGAEVTGWPVEGTTDGSMQHLFQNQIRPLALSRAGATVLHGSAVSIDGSCVAFLGESGRGKSTLAASFAMSGSPFLTDDALIVEREGSRWLTPPGHPSIRLWEDSERAVLGTSAEAAPPVQYTQKARFLAQGAIPFCDQPQEIRCFYFIGDRDTSELELDRLAPRNALIEFVRNSFLLDTEDKDELARHFEDLSDLLGHPAMFRLDYPRRYDKLGEVRDAIAAHARQGHWPGE